MTKLIFNIIRDYIVFRVECLKSWWNTPKGEPSLKDFYKFVKKNIE